MNWSGNYSGYSAWTPACDHTPKKIFEHEGVSYYAADEDGADEFGAGLVLNLTARSHILPSFSIPELKKHFAVEFDEVMVPCPDFGIPKVKDSFWRAIHKYSVKKGYKDVCVHCMGGHGRTGTALAALMIVLKKWSTKQAVTFLRTNYCEQAVESERQVDYLRELDETMNGRPYNHHDGLEGSAYIKKRKDDAKEEEKNVGQPQLVSLAQSLSDYSEGDNSTSDNTNSGDSFWTEEELIKLGWIDPSDIGKK